jgi:hypothetical protein
VTYSEKLPKQIQSSMTLFFGLYKHPRTVGRVTFGPRNRLAMVKVLSESVNLENDTQALSCEKKEEEALLLGDFQE